MKKNTNKIYLVVSTIARINRFVLAIIAMAMLLFILTQTHYYETITLYPISLYMLAAQLIIEGVLIVLESFDLKQNRE